MSNCDLTRCRVCSRKWGGASEKACARGDCPVQRPMTTPGATEAVTPEQRATHEQIAEQIVERGSNHVMPDDRRKTRHLIVSALIEAEANALRRARRETLLEIVSLPIDLAHLGKLGEELSERPAPFADERDDELAVFA